jgi:hypothetical protein
VKTLILAFLCLFFAAQAEAVLLSRKDGQAYYDTVLDITWLANANAAAGSVYDDGPNATDGRVTWASAQAFIASLNAQVHLGRSDWRLPIILDTGPPGCEMSFTGGTDCGYNVQSVSMGTCTVTSEIAHMYFSTLNNRSYYDTNGMPAQLGWNIKNSVPFSNVKIYYYWSLTEWVYNPTEMAWYFDFVHGFQNRARKTVQYNHVWPIVPGDIGD